MEVRNRDILVYERLHGAAAAKGPIEHLLPDSEQPVTPPAPSRPAENVSPPNATPTDSLGSEASRGTSLLVPPVPEPPARSSVEADKATQSQQSQKTKLSPSPAGAGPVPAQPTMHSQPAPPSQTKVATVTATESTRTQPERPASGNGFQLQLLSSRSADDAKGAWARLRDKNADLLGSLSPSVARVNLDDRGTFYRLRAGPIASETKARSICDSLAARRVSCLVVRSSG